MQQTIVVDPDPLSANSASASNVFTKKKKEEEKKNLRLDVLIHVFKNKF